jgi:hypothetical protein
MSDRQLQDAYLRVTIDLPDGSIIHGKPILYPDAVKLIALRDAFAMGEPEAWKPLLADFHRLSGITEDDLKGLSIGEVIDTINRFFAWRRPVRTPAQTSPALGAPDPTPPSGA